MNSVIRYKYFNSLYFAFTLLANSYLITTVFFRFNFVDAEISSDGASSEGVCDMCQERQAPPQTHRAVFGKAIVHWVECDICERWFHQCCTELDANVDVSTIVHKCFHCKPKVCTQ